MMHHDNLGKRPWSSICTIRNLGAWTHCAVWKFGSSCCAMECVCRPHPEAPNTPPANFSEAPKLMQADLKADMQRFEGKAHTMTTATA